MSIGKHCWRVVLLCFEKLIYHGHVTHCGREGEGLGVVGLGIGLVLVGVVFVVVGGHRVVV